MDWFNFSLANWSVFDESDWNGFLLNDGAIGNFYHTRPPRTVRTERGEREQGWDPRFT